MLVRRLALAVLLAASGAAACSPSPELRRVRAPREGVTLAYVLPRGQGFEGQLHVGNTRAVDGLDAPLSQTATSDVTLVVLGPVEGGTEVRATFGTLDLDWDLPPTATYSSQELLELAHARLRGMQVSLVVRADGRVESIPPPPADAPPELAEVIETLVRGVEASFVPLPPEPLRGRGEWTAHFEHVTAAGLRMELDQTMELGGVFELRSDEQRVTKLLIEQSRREQRMGPSGPVTVEREVRSLVMFSSAGFPLELDRETRQSDPIDGTVFRKVRAQWSPVRGVAPELFAPPGSDVQVINDPCNPDYVGPEVCPSRPDPDEGDEPDEGDGAPPPEDVAPEPMPATEPTDDADADPDDE